MTKEAALWGMAGSVAYQRLAGEFNEETGELLKDSPHWASDVWFGAWWGLAVANIVISNDELGDDVQVTTGVDAATGAFQLGVHVRF